MVSRRIEPLSRGPFAEDEMGEGTLHRAILTLLQVLVRAWVERKGMRVYVGSNQFIDFAGKRIAPDLYLLPSDDPDPDFSSWNVDASGVAPTFVLEVVSEDVPKDYTLAPARYDEMGVRELIVFDPRAGRSKKRVRWQTFRRDASGAWSRVESSQGDRARSEELGCWLRTTGGGGKVRLRLAEGPDGDVLVPTREEGLEDRAVRFEKEAARLRAELEALKKAR